ncbi:hypothetical protein JB92DRAFT_2938932, partial [Gautieria morchelliformis]
MQMTVLGSRDGRAFAGYQHAAPSSSMLNAASMLLIAFRTTRVCSRVRDYLYICPGARPMRGGEGGRPKSTNESSSRCRNTAASRMDAGSSPDSCRTLRANSIDARGWRRA